MEICTKMSEFQPKYALKPEKIAEIYITKECHLLFICSSCNAGAQSSLKELVVHLLRNHAVSVVCEVEEEFVKEKRNGDVQSCINSAQLKTRAGVLYKNTEIAQIFITLEHSLVFACSLCSGHSNSNLQELLAHSSREHRIHVLYAIEDITKQEIKENDMDDTSFAIKQNIKQEENTYTVNTDEKLVNFMHVGECAVKEESDSEPEEFVSEHCAMTEDNYRKTPEQKTTSGVEKNRPKRKCTLRKDKTYADLTESDDEEDPFYEDTDEDGYLLTESDTGADNSYERCSPNEGDYLCVICNSKFEIREDLKRHLKIHTNNKTVLPENKFKGENRKPKFIEPTAERKHQCKFCGFTAKMKGHLNAHMARHSDDKPFPCSQCPKRFYTRPEAKRHELYHTQERPLLCVRCGRKFFIPAHLNYHMNTAHGDVTTKVRKKPSARYNCESCEKTYSSKSSLKVHIETHTKEHQYVCDICSFQFTSRRALKRHTLQHQKRGKFVLSEHLVKQMKIDADKQEFLCKICNRAFTNTTYLTVHMRIHLEDDNSCERRESKKARLVWGRKQEYACSICDKSFRYKRGLQRHLKKHSKAVAV